MKTHALAATLVTIVLPLGAMRAASESFILETHVYVYRDSDFRVVKIPAATAADATHGVVFSSPAVAQFDEEKLSLDGPRFAWSGGRNPPDRFSLIATPTVPLAPGKPVTLLSTAPVQYLEKLANGTLSVREIERDSPEAPHCRLTFAIGPAGGAGQDLHLACDLDIATVSARQNLAGVALDVGKPELARSKEKLDAVVRLDEWSALRLQAPNRSAYSLLVLLKIVPGRTPRAVANAGQAGVLTTAARPDKSAAYDHSRAIGSAIPPVGSVSVLSFDYLPAKSGDVSPNRAQGLPPGLEPGHGVYFDRNVDVLVREALLRKLASAGVKVDSPDKKLSGEIEELSIKNMSSSSCVLRIRYIITAGTAVTYDSVKEVARTREGLFDPHTAVDDLVDLSILELLKDQAFLNAIK